ncbi:MAG: hypothetical protein QOJ09_62 [Actinomycetota bacterium]|nr:hypothetical protein [Actinomycetota bacterium]
MGTVRKNIASVVISVLAVATFVVVSEGSAPGAGVQFPGAQFSGFSTGTNVHADVLRTSSAGPVIADAEVAFSGAAVGSNGFAPSGVHNEENIAVVPTPGVPDASVDSTGKESFGKGTGLEVGLGTALPNDDLNQVVLGGRAEAAAQPAQRSDGDPVVSANDTGDVDTSLATITQADPLLYAQALLGHARARWDETQCLRDGNISEGEGRVAKAQLVDSAGNPATSDLDAPLVDVNSDFFGTPRAAADTQSFSYLVPNPDGTFGLTTETHMTFAPIGLLQTDPTKPAPIYVEILGEWVFRATATGKQGGSAISYTVEGPSTDPDTPVIRIYLGATDASAVPTIEIKRSQLFTDTGIIVDLPPGPGPRLLSLHVGEDARAISDPNVAPDPTSKPTQATDGTVASGAADVIRIDALNADPLDPNGPRVAGVRIGHVEAEAKVPADGIACPVPAAPAGATTTTAAGATTTTTAASATTTTPTAPGATTTTTAAPNNTAATTTTTIAADVLAQQFTRAPSPPAQAVTAQPRFTG